VMCGLLQCSVAMRLKYGIMRVLNIFQLCIHIYVVYAYRFFSVDCFMRLDRLLQSSKHPLIASCCVDTNHRSKYLVDFVAPKGSIRTFNYKKHA